MSGPDAAAESSLDVLLRCVDLEALDADLFLGDPGPGRGTLFGGMVAAQAVIAAHRTVPEGRRMHSLHAYFVRPGRHDVPLRFVVDRIRDGRSFTTRRVRAHQAGETIFNLSASFCVDEEGIAHQDPMPPVIGPEELEDWEIVRKRLNPKGPNFHSPVEVRMIDEWRDEPMPARQRCWMRLRGALPDDPVLHTAMLVYATDRTLLGTASRPHAIPFEKRFGASLDHAVWIHHPVRLDGWLLYTAESPIAQGAHGMIFGAIYAPDGRRIASVAQEGLIRRLA